MANKAQGIGNAAVWNSLAYWGFTTCDGWDASKVTTQAGAQPIIGPVTRVTTSIANGALGLKSLATGEAFEAMFVINDSPNTIVVFCFSGEKMNGSSNGSLSIPSGQAGVFFPVTNSVAQQFAAGATNAPDWRSAALP